MPDVLKSDNLKNDVKLEYQEKRADKIFAQTKNIVKCKNYIGCIYFGHI